MLKYDDDVKIASENEIITALENGKWIEFQPKMWKIIFRFNFSVNKTEAIRLIEAGFDANVTDEFNQSPMHLAAQSGNCFKEKWITLIYNYLKQCHDF